MQTIFTVDGSGKCYKSADNGATWGNVSTGLPSRPLAAVSAQSGLNVAIGGKSVGGTKASVFVTVNGGTSWTEKSLTPLPTPLPNSLSYVLGISWITSTVMFVHVQYSNSIYLLKSTNSGNTFTLMQTKTPSNFFPNCRFVDANTGFWNGYKTTDGGATVIGTTWQYGIPQRGGTKAIFSGSAGLGVSADDGGTIDYNADYKGNAMFANGFPRSIDGKYMGYYWVNLGASGNFMNYHARELVSGSAYSSIVIAQVADTIKDLFFVSGNIGLAATNNGFIYRTVDAGTTWKQLPQFTGSGVALFAIDGGTEPDTCTLNGVIGAQTPEVNGGDGTVSFSATGAAGYEYAIYKVGATPGAVIPMPSNPYTATGLTAGDYNLLLQDSTNPSCQQIYPFTVDYSKLTGAGQATPNSFFGNCDGTISLQAFHGSGNYNLQVVGYPVVNQQSTTFTGLCEGLYDAYITDAVTGQQVYIQFHIGALVPPPGNDYMKVPSMNSLSFIQEATIDNCNIFQTMDNTLFCKQKFPGFFWQNYSQKVAQCDKFAIQFISNYQTNLVEMRDYASGDLITNNFSLVVKEQNTNILKEFDIFITKDTSVGKSRVYFQAESFPLPLVVNGGFEIFDSFDGFNGNYTILAINFDELMGKQYLLINKLYTPTTPSSIASARFLVNEQDFDVYEFQIDFSVFDEGTYYFKIKGTSGQQPQEWISEPVEVKAQHEMCLFFQYRNFDNAYDMTYSTGIVCQRRIESRMFNRTPKGVDDSYRNVDQSLVKLSAKRQRTFLLELFLLPPYLHELMAVMFGHDFVAINGVRHQTNDQYDDPQYITRYPLSNSKISVEQYGWFDLYNSDDIGPVDNVDSSFIIANGGFLKR